VYFIAYELHPHFLKQLYVTNKDQTTVKLKQESRVIAGRPARCILGSLKSRRKTAHITTLTLSLKFRKK